MKGFKGQVLTERFTFKLSPKERRNLDARFVHSPYEDRSDFIRETLGLTEAFEPTPRGEARAAKRKAAKRMKGARK